MDIKKAAWHTHRKKKKTAQTHQIKYPFSNKGQICADQRPKLGGRDSTVSHTAHTSVIFLSRKRVLSHLPPQTRGTHAGRFLTLCPCKHTGTYELTSARRCVCHWFCKWQRKVGSHRQYNRHSRRVGRHKRMSIYHFRAKYRRAAKRLIDRIKEGLKGGRFIRWSLTPTAKVSGRGLGLKCG